jgi:hypothetical protein
MVSEEEIDLMASVMVARLLCRAKDLEVQQVAKAYEALARIPEAERNPDRDLLVPALDPGQMVEDGVNRLMLEGAPAAWPLLRRIVELCPRDPYALGLVGAGLFENWVTEDRVTAIAPQLRDLLRTDPKWRVVTEASWDEPPALVLLLADPSNVPAEPL